MSYHTIENFININKYLNLIKSKRNGFDNVKQVNSSSQKVTNYDKK